MAHFDERHGTRLFGKDSDIENEIGQMAGGWDFDTLAVRFPLLIRRTWLKKCLAHYELYRKIKDVDGDIVELGVFRGLSLFSFALFNEFWGTRNRTVYGVDNFMGFTNLTPEDGEAYDVPKFEGGFSPGDYYGELMEHVRIFNDQAKKTQIRILKGNVEDVMAGLAEQTSSIALIHFDVDMYTPTKAGLEHLYPLVPDKGVVVFDEYGQLEWSGETRAVDEYFNGSAIELKKFPWQPAPAAYFVKQEGL